MRFRRRLPALGIGLLIAVALLPLQAVMAAPGVSFSSNQHLVDPTQILGSPNFDSEPSIKVDSGNNVYIGAIHGVPGGSVMWKAPAGSCSSSGCNASFLGEIDSFGNSTGIAPGGGDIDLAIGSYGAGRPGPLVAGSLWLGSVTVARSTDGGQTFFTNPFGSVIPGVDRQWLANDGPTTFYMTYHDVATFNIDVQRSTDGGLTWLPVGTAIDTNTAPAALGATPTSTGNLAGEIQVDPVRHVLYQVFAAPSTALQNQTGGPPNAVYMGVSSDGGQSWTDHLVYAGPTTASYAHIFPAAAVDAGGNVYALWSDGSNIFLSSSTNQGQTWSAPHQVNQNGSQLQTSIFPWIAAGQAGGVDIVWYGTSATTAGDPAAQWNVFLAQSLNATAAAPTFGQTVASDHVIHTGPVCESGLNCSGTGNRNLADLFTVAVDSSGAAYIAYTDDHQKDSSGNAIPQIYITHQTGGPTVGSPTGTTRAAGKHARGSGAAPGPKAASQFGFDVADLGTGAAGAVTLVDPTSNVNFAASSIGNLTVSGSQATVAGNSNLGAFTLTVDSGAQTFNLSTANGYTAAGPLVSGTVDVWSL